MSLALSVCGIIIDSFSEMVCRPFQRRASYMQAPSLVCSLEAVTVLSPSTLPRRYTSWLFYFFDLSMIFIHKFTHLTSGYSDTLISSYLCSQAGLIPPQRDVYTRAAIQALPIPLYWKQDVPIMVYLLRLYLAFYLFLVTEFLFCKGFLPSIQTQRGRFHTSTPVLKRQDSSIFMGFHEEFGRQQTNGTKGRIGFHLKTLCADINIDLHDFYPHSARSTGKFWTAL